jgi:aspartate-semialdehyde dehydrogenase
MNRNTHERGRAAGVSAREDGAPWGWDAAHRELRVAVVGATGAVGRELLELLADADHPAQRIDASARRASSLEIGRGRRVAVRALSVEPRDVASGIGLDECDLAFLCTPSDVSLALAPELVERGVRVIDLSSAHRMMPDIPLVVPEINAAELDRSPRLIANPNCTTAIAALPLAVIDRAAGLSEVVVVSFQAASGAGLAGLRTLELEARRAAGAAPPTSTEIASPFPSTLALNVIPAVADVDAQGVSGEERKVVDETRKILGRPDLVVDVTTTRVPVERCHSVAIHAITSRELPLARVRELLAEAPGIALTDDPHGPRPKECAGTDPVHVGRIRKGGRGSRSLCFFAVGDQLRKGAALNALQIAARLPAR